MRGSNRVSYRAELLQENLNSLFVIGSWAIAPVPLANRGVHTPARAGAKCRAVEIRPPPPPDSKSRHQ
jgi:hypothetical protein